MWGERGYSDGFTHYLWLSSIALLLCLPGFPPAAFPTTISSLISPQSVSPQSTAALALGLLHNPQILAPSHCIPGNQGSSLEYVWLWQGQMVILFRLPLISCFTLSLKCFSSDSDNCPYVGIGPLLQFPRLLRAGPVLLTLLFFPLVPLSYKVLSGSLYSFPLLRYSYPPSAGILRALLCLKVYSWGIRGQKYNPCPPTPPPSSYFPERSFKVYNLQKISFKYINSS